MHAVVGGVENDGVVSDPQVVDQLQELADMHVVLDHPVLVLVPARPGDADVLLFHVRAEVHARAVPPREPGLAGFLLPLDEVRSGGDGLIVDRLHALFRQRTCVFDGLAPFAVGFALDHAAWAELLPEFRVLGIIAVFRLLLGVEVIEVAHEFVEAVVGRQVLVAVALMVFSELAGGVAHPLHHGGNGYVDLLPAFLGAGQPDLGHACPNRHVAA